MRVDLIGDMLGRIQTAEDIQTLEGHLGWMRDRLSAMHVVYHWVNAGGELVGAGTYDKDWRDTYIGAGYTKVDPVVLAGLKSPKPFLWQSLDWSSKGAQALKSAATTAGIGEAGITMPVHGPIGQFSHMTMTYDATAERFAKEVESLAPSLLLIGHAVNCRTFDLRHGPDLTVSPPLSPRERDALEYLASGLSRDRAAERMNISSHTLRVYIEGARTKLGAANTVHAVSIALKTGVISL